jgi:hypothetical protein
MAQDSRGLGARYVRRGSPPTAEASVARSPSARPSARVISNFEEERSDALGADGDSFSRASGSTPASDAGQELEPMSKAPPGTSTRTTPVSIRG